MGFSAAVVGVGAVGARAARRLQDDPSIASLAISGSSRERMSSLEASLGEVERAGPDGADVVVLAGPTGTHASVAASLLEAGSHVVSTSDDLDEVIQLLALHPLAVESGVHLVVGAAFSPGMSCVLASHAASAMDSVTEVHVARAGTGGPACARAHHRALRSRALDWRDHAWVRRPGGSGRELCVFPEPIGSADCYRARLPDALLLEPAIDGVERITARQQANRRDRLTSWLPMLRSPHPEGLVGAVRIEVRGHRDGAAVTDVLGVFDRPAVAAGVVAATAAVWAGSGRLTRTGAGGLAELVGPLPFLRSLAERGVSAARFTGSPV